MRVVLSRLCPMLLALLASTTLLASDLNIPSLDEPVSIAGAWHFQTGDNMAWADPEFNDRSWSSVMVPKNLNQQGFDNFSGMAWYRLSLKFDRDMPGMEGQLDQLGVTLGKVHSAYELYAGGRLLGGMGRLPSDSLMHYDRYRTYSIPADAISAEGRVVLAVRIWSQELYPGGVAAGAYEGPFEVGRLGDLGESLGRSQVQSLVLCLLYVMFGLYHLYLFNRNPQFRQYLCFGMLSMAVASYSFLTSQWSYVLDVPFVTVKKVEYAVLYVTPAILMSMLWALLDVRPPRWERWYQRLFIASAVVVLLVPGFEVLFRSLHLWQLAVIPIILGMTYRVIHYAHSGNTEARTILVGMLFFAGACLHDIALDHGLLTGQPLMTLGFAAILVSMALSMANHITRMFNNLESEVQERTRELTELNTRLDEAASVDALTRILNRRGFSQKADLEIARVGRTHRGFALIMSDIDYFKAFNDQYGHACGDFILERVAVLLREQLRDVDIMARWGGEEFIFLLPETTIDGGEVLAEKLRLALENHLFEYMGHSLSLTMTFGVSRFKYGQTFDDCLLRADRALYQGKQLGRNRVEAEADERQIDLLNQAAN